MEVNMKNVRKGDLYGWIVSASMLIYGYSLAMSAAINPIEIVQYYQVSFNQSLMISCYNGLFAFGGMLGSFLSGFFVLITTKRKSFFISTTIIIISCATSAVPIIGVLFASRFLLGFGCSLSTILGGTYIRQIFSQTKRKSMGGVFSLSKMIGAEICIVLSYLLTKYQVIGIHHYINLGCGTLAAIHFLLTKLVIPQIPLEMYIKNQADQLNAVLSFLYEVQDIPIKLEQLKLVSFKLALPLDIDDEVTKKQIISAIYCGFIRHFCGVSYFIVYLSQILQKFDSLSPNMPNLLSSGLRVVFGTIGVFLVCTLNRRKLIIFSTIIGCVFCFLASTFNGLQFTNLSLAAVVFYLIPIVGCLQIVTWYHPFECSRPVYCKYAAIASWFGMGCLTIIPPYVSAAMPNNQCYPTLVFFGVFLLLCVYINYSYLVDVDIQQKALKENNNLNTAVQLNNRENHE